MNPSEQIDQEIARLQDWRGSLLADIRRVVRAADPKAVEEWKWMGTACWSHEGLLCSADAHPGVVKVIFFKGARLVDPFGLFNGELEGNTRRAIMLSEGDAVNEGALTALVQAAAAFNLAKETERKEARPKRAIARAAQKAERAAKATGPKRAPPTKSGKPGKFASKAGSKPAKPGLKAGKFASKPGKAASKPGKFGQRPGKFARSPGKPAAGPGKPRRATSHRRGPQGPR